MVIPMTAKVIAWVNYLGQGEKSLLTFQNRRGDDIGGRTANRIGADKSDVQPIKYNMPKTDSAVDNTEINLDVVDDITGVDSLYKEYVDE